MGDMLLKQKPRWQQGQVDMHRRPWPPMFRAPFQRVPPFNFRPVDQTTWREPFQYQTNGFSPAQTNKSRDYYFLAPYYRNVMPPPPKLQKDRPLMVDTTRRRTNKRTEDKASCHCKSRSMEDVRFDVVEVQPEWEQDENGNDVSKTKKAAPFGLKPYGQHSMENLLVDTGYTSPSKRAGRFKVIEAFYFL